MRPGELWPQEREFLFQAIVQKQPTVVLEIGTGGGGGSTHQIAKALKENFLSYQIQGHLHTCEIDTLSFRQAQKMYCTEFWSPFVTCYHMTSTGLIQQLIDRRQIPDLIFFDGPEDPQVALADIKQLEPCLKPGTWLSVHDWDLGIRADGCESTKVALLRPYVEASEEWTILNSLTAPHSVGIVLAEYSPLHHEFNPSRPQPDHGPYPA